MAMTAQKPDVVDVDVATVEKPPFQLADLYRLRLAKDPAVSPDGRRVAFVIYSFWEDKNEAVTHL